MDKSYTLSEVASILNVHKDTLRQLIVRHRYFYKVGRRFFFRQKDVDKLLEVLRAEARAWDPDKHEGTTTLSGERAYQKALAMLEKPKAPAKSKREKAAERASAVLERRRKIGQT